MLTKQELMNKMEHLLAEVQSVQLSIQNMKDEQVSGRFIPEKGDVYWTIMPIKDAPVEASAVGPWSGHHVDKWRHLLGLVYRTKGEAERAIERQRVHNELLDAAGGFVPDWNAGSQNKWAVTYDHADRKLIYCLYASWQIAGGVYFPSREVLQAAVEKIGTERVERYCKGE